MSYFRYHVFFCTNQRDDHGQRCKEYNTTAARAYLKKRTKELGIKGAGGVRINSAGCLDRCTEGPVIVVYPEAIWYTYVNHDDLDEILHSHLIGGEPVARLRLPDTPPPSLESQ